MCKINDSSKTCHLIADKYWWLIWIVLGLAVISLIISIWSIILANAAIADDSSLIFDTNSLVTIIGFILATVALVVSLFFIILGIGSNSIRKEIKEDVKDAKREIGNIRNKADEVNNDIVNTSNNIDKASKDNKEQSVTTIYNLYSDAIALTQRSYELINIKGNCSIIHHADCKQIKTVMDQFSKEITSLKLEQSRIACDKRNLDIEDRIMTLSISSINIIKDLSMEEDDLQRLKEVQENTKSDLIEYTARSAYEALYKRLHPEK